MNWKVFAKAILTRNEAKLTRRIGVGLITAIIQDRNSFELQLEMANGSVKFADEWLRMESAQGPIELVEGKRFLRALTGIDLNGNPDSDMFQFLSAATVGRLSDTPFNVVTKLSPDSTDKLPNGVTIMISLRSRDHVITTYGRGNSLTWLSLIQNWKWRRPKNSESRYTRCQVHIPIKLASQRITRKLFTTVAAGDIFLPREAMFDCRGQGHFCAGNVMVHVEHGAPNRLTVMKVESKMQEESSDYEHDGEYDDADHDDGMDSDSPEYYLDEPDDDSVIESDDEASKMADIGSSDAAVPDSGSDGQPLDEDGGRDTDREKFERSSSSSNFDSIPVCLDFELGHLQLSMGQLKTLAPGVVLHVLSGSNADVAIKAGGKQFGTGEIVEVNGKLGVRITEWS